MRLFRIGYLTRYPISFREVFVKIEILYYNCDKCFSSKSKFHKYLRERYIKKTKESRLTI